MRILAISHEFPPIGGGGGKAAQDIYTRLAAQGHEIVFLTAYLKGLPRQETVSGIQVVRLRSLRTQAFRASFVSMAAFAIRAVFAGASYIRKWQPDMVHVQFAVPAGPVGWLLHKLYGIPYIVSSHLGDIPGGVPSKTDGWFRFVRPFTPPIWTHAAAAVAVSEFTRGLIEQHYGVQAEVINNGANISEMNPGTIQVNSPPRLTFAARFVDQKNPIRLVQALEQIKDLPWDFVMMGDGPEKPNIVAALKRAGIEDRVQFTGWVKPEQVIEEFGNSDILFMPSLVEGLPVVGLQALGMGLAIVAGSRGGFLDVVAEGQVGYLVDPFDVDDMAARLRELLEDPDKLLAFRLASRERSHKFDLDHIASRYADLFQRVKEQNQP